MEGWAIVLVLARCSLNVRCVSVVQELEAEVGDEAAIAELREKVPRKVKKRRRIEGDIGWEEYYDYIFPDEADAAPHLKLLELARKWKAKQAADDDDDDEEEDDEDDDDNDE